MRLLEIQRELEAIYRIERTPDVGDFILPTESAKQILETNDEPRPQLLFREGDGEVFFAVHFGDQNLTELEQKSPEELTLSNFLTIAEELSHFVYVSWSARNQSPVSLLNIELQGEIDKFILALALRNEERKSLMTSLFDDWRIHESCEEEEFERYEEANRLGRKVCQSIPEPFHLQWLREFYRLTSQRRLAAIESL